jgi:hypothetical protein
MKTNDKQTPLITSLELLNAGFIPPLSSYSRPDARGIEYGAYFVTVSDGEILVEYRAEYRGHQTCYKFRFDASSDFLAWAKNTF